MGGRGPLGLGRSSRKPLESRSVSMYPGCLYLRSLSMGKGCSVTRGTKERSVEKTGAYDTDLSPRGRAVLPTTAFSVDLPEGFCGNAEAPDTIRFAARHCFKYICTTDRSQMHMQSRCIWIGAGRLPYGPANRSLTLTARKAGCYPTELHFSRLVQGRVMGSSKWLGLTRRA